jgi:ferrous iron transport protein B
MNAVKLENSYIGILGKTIEPAIAPLGFDWKIGISLITSFAAREVFVGSMATIYSVNEDFENDDSLMTRLKNEINPHTGKPVYTLATGMSLMIFYVYAMQCMATLAVVKRETKSWKWPLIQLAYMGAMAYLAAFIAFNILN